MGVWASLTPEILPMARSDSVVSASREIAAFFPDFSEQRWYEEEEPQLRCGPVHYSAEEGIHCASETGGPKPA